MNIRDILMAGYLLVWMFVIVVVVLRTGQPPTAELWAALGVGEGALMAVFRVDENVKRRKDTQNP